MIGLKDGALRETENGIWSWPVAANSGQVKTLQLVHGDLCTQQEACDIVVCSAFKDDYFPTETSLIGALLRKKGISVHDLAQDPELNFKAMGCWLSRETESSFRRVACVELLEYAAPYTSGEMVDIIIKRTFSTLRFLLEQANISQIPMETIALPILGTGNQQIQMAYVLGTLIAQCRTILQSNTGVNRIIIYERDPARANIVAEVLNQALAPKDELPQVFLSYSSKQLSVATEIRDWLEEHRVMCWMAPESIPAGSSYIEVIPAALSRADVVLLILTPDAEQSRWVQKEICTAVGADKIIIPYQPEVYPVGNRFKFLLDGEQFLQGKNGQKEDEYTALLNRLEEVVKNGNTYF